MSFLRFFLFLLISLNTLSFAQDAHFHERLQFKEFKDVLEIDIGYWSNPSDDPKYPQIISITTTRVIEEPSPGKKGPSTYCRTEIKANISYLNTYTKRYTYEVKEVLAAHSTFRVHLIGTFAVNTQDDGECKTPQIPINQFISSESLEFEKPIEHWEIGNFIKRKTKVRIQVLPPQSIKAKFGYLYGEDKLRLLDQKIEPNAMPIVYDIYYKSNFFSKTKLQNHNEKILFPIKHN